MGLPRVLPPALRLRRRRSSELQLFRTPLTPIVVGLPLDLGGIWLLEVVFALLYATSILAWSATALHFGRIPALFSALLLLVYPAYATLYHQASSDAVFATGLAVWALLLARALRRAVGWTVRRASGAGIAAARPHPARRTRCCCRSRSSRRSSRTSPGAAGSCSRRRASSAAVLPLAAWALHNGVRYDDTTVARGGRAWVPFLQVFTVEQDDLARERPGVRAARRADRGGGALARARTRASTSRSTRTSANGSNYETVRLIALSDSVLGRDENYDVLFDSAVEAIREHPGDVLPRRRRHVLGVPAAEAAPRGRRPARADGARGARADVRVGRRRAPEPAGHGPRRRRAVRLRLVRVRLHRLVHARRPVGRSGADPGTQERYREIVAPGAGVGRRAPGAGGRGFVPEILNRITPRFPTPLLWLAVGVVALVVAASARLAHDPPPVGARRSSCCSIHAASQGVAPEFALPLYPIFIVTALGALAGDRRADQTGS